jgi:hypothetical protein
MKHGFFCGTRLRVLGVLTIAAAFFTFAGVANAATLNAGATLGFSGQFTNPAMVPLGVCPASTLNPDGLVNCQYFSFTAGAAGDVTLLFDLEDGFNFGQAEAYCSGTLRDVAFSNEGATSEAITFAVVANEICEVRISLDLADPVTMEATPMNPLRFTGSVSLSGTAGGGGGGGGTGGGTDSKLVSVTGGGQVDPNKSFTSSAKPKGDAAQGTIRYFTSTCKAWSVELYDVSGVAFADGGSALVHGRAKVQTGNTTTYKDFTARYEDGGEGGTKRDTVTIDLCDNPVQNPIDSGNIQIHPVS